MRSLPQVIDGVLYFAVIDSSLRNLKQFHIEYTRPLAATVLETVLATVAPCTHRLKVNQQRVTNATAGAELILASERK